MSTSRQRMLDTFEFRGPDKLPVVYHPSPAGLHVHGQKLLDLFRAFPPDNPIAFDMLPAPPPGTVDSTGRYHEVRKDEWGTEWQFRIFGVQGHPLRYPFPHWEAARNYAFPPLSTALAQDRDLATNRRKAYLVFSSMISLFEKLHALRPMDEVLMDLLTEDKHLMLFLDRLTDYCQEKIQALIDMGMDVIFFGDDWGTQSSTLVSPDLFRRLFKPRYVKLMAPIRAAGRKIFFHSCGFLGGIFDELLDLGIDGLWPQITRFEDNPAFPEICKDHGVTLYIHPDRQTLIPLGTPQDIERTIRGCAERYRRLGGGGIFYVEIENDAPYENVEALIRAVHRYR